MDWLGGSKLYREMNEYSTVLSMRNVSINSANNANVYIIFD